MKIAEKALPKQTFGDMIMDGVRAVAKGVAKLVGLPMDKPAITINPTSVYRRPFQNISNTVGPEVTNRMDLDPSTQNMSEPAHFSTERDEMQMAVLLHHLTYSESLAWSATAPPGSLITSRFIGSMCNLF